MKKTLSLLLAFAAGLALQAQQTFTAVNAEGVTITYKTTSDSTVEVARADYSGRVVVPESVTHEGTEYFVTKVGARAFYNSAVSYVELPATISDLGLMCLAANSLDSVRFNSPEPPARANYTMVEILGNKLPERVTVIVPCGRLERWKENGWRVVKFVKSDCAHRLTVTPTFDDVLRVDSVVDGSDVRYSNGYYETGDTARLYAQRFYQSDVNTPQRFGYLIGWSTGSTGPYVELVMPDHDMEVECIVDTMPRATLSASRITTPVYTFGTLGYDGEVTDFRFRDVHYMYDNAGEEQEVWPSTLFASSIWLSASDDACAVSRFFSSGSDFIPGPLRLDGTTDVATARRYSRVWHVTREMIDYHIAHCGEAGYTVPDDIMTWPGNGPDGYADQLAPYYDADGNGHYWAPAGDYPIIRGDECVYSIFNDAAMHFESNNSLSMGVEVHCMTYAFDEPQDSVLWNSVFQHYDIYNRSPNDYDEVYLGMFTDFDIGYAWDDYIGCHVQYDMYYGYNGSAHEAPGLGSFQGAPPAQGTLILSADGQPGMTSFLAYDNVNNSVMGEPVTASDYRNYLQGKMKNGGTPWSGPNGEYPFMYPAGSDPAFGYVDEMSEGNAPGDRRGVGGSGPYSLASGASQSFDVAFLTAWTDEQDCVGCSRTVLVGQAPDLRRQWLRDTTDSGRPFVYMPYSAPHEVGIEGADAASLCVYPNPTMGRLTVSVPEETDVEVHDMMGRRLMAVHARQGAVALDLAALPQGVYLLRAAGAVSRIVKQ